MFETEAYSISRSLKMDGQNGLRIVNSIVRKRNTQQSENIESTSSWKLGPLFGSRDRCFAKQDSKFALP